MSKDEVMLSLAIIDGMLNTLIDVNEVFFPERENKDQLIKKAYQVLNSELDKLSKI